MSTRRLRLLTPAFALCLALAIAAVAQAGSLGSRVLRTGSRGHDVVQLQRALVIFGYRVSVDGIYGAQTRRAVRRYERAHRFHEYRQERRDQLAGAPLQRVGGEETAGAAAGVLRPVRREGGGLAPQHAGKS